MELTIPIANRPLKGTVEVPGDKSLAHRAALFAALAEGVSEVSNYPDSGVTRAMRGALASLGVPSTLEGGVLRLSGNGLRPFPVSGAVAYCGNSATTIRLLAGAVAATGSTAVLDGSAAQTQVFRCRMPRKSTREGDENFLKRNSLRIIRVFFR